MESGNINKRVASKVLNNLSKGTVPRVGAKYIAVGRKDEIEAFVMDLEDIEEGMGAFRIISARYGGGKSFMLNLMKDHALLKDYVVMNTQMGENHLFKGNRDVVMNLYGSLITNTSIKGQPDGNGLETLLQKWIDKIKKEVAKSTGYPPESVPFSYVESAMRAKIDEMRNELESSTFRRMIYGYAKAYNSSEDVEPYLKWFKGEYKTKTELKDELGYNISMVTKDNWFQYIRLWSEFVVDVGYRGLLVQFDEAQILSKLSKKKRTENYETLLRMFNSTIQDDVAHLGVYVCVIPETLDDKQRGIYSYDALRTRIEPSIYQQPGDYSSGCVMTLKPLANEELFTLLDNVCILHEVKNGYGRRISQEELIGYLNHVYGSIGADEFLTPRALLKNFIAILDRLYKNPDESLSSIVGLIPMEDDIDPFDKQLDDFDLEI